MILTYSRRERLDVVVTGRTTGGSSMSIGVMLVFDRVDRSSLHKRKRGVQAYCIENRPKNFPLADLND